MVKTLDATLIHTNCHADVLHIHSPRTVSVDVCKSTPRFLQLEKELEEHSEQLGFNKKLCAVDLQITLYDEFAKLCQHVKGLQLIKWKIQIINVKQKHRSCACLVSQACESFLSVCPQLTSIHFL